MERVRLACVRHAASVRPEPGSNSPSRLQATLDLTRRSTVDRESESCHVLTRTMTTTGTANPRRGSRACVYCVLTYNPSSPANRRARIARTGFWLSLFRFQGATGHTPLQPVLVPGFLKDCSGRRNAPASLLQLPEGHGGPFRRVGYVSRPRRGRQRARAGASGCPWGPGATTPSRAYRDPGAGMPMPTGPAAPSSAGPVGAPRFPRSREPKAPLGATRFANLSTCRRMPPGPQRAPSADALLASRPTRRRMNRMPTGATAT